MTRCRPGTLACALLLLGLLAPPATQAACSDKTLRNLSDAGRSVATIAKRCGMSAAAVRERLDPGAKKADRAASEPATARAAPSADASSSVASPTASTAKPAAKPPAEAEKHPPGTILEPCGCYGSMEYGFTEPNATCLSGKAVATRCPGYCPVNRSPWRRICS